MFNPLLMNRILDAGSGGRPEASVTSTPANIGAVGHPVPMHDAMNHPLLAHISQIN
jgi:hypothetical protein